MQDTEGNPIDKLPDIIRVSVGSAVVLGLLEGKLDADPTTAYLMTYTSGRCTANCGFCSQARSSLSKSALLSRVTWPTFQTKQALEGIETAFNKSKVRRVCIQALNYPEVFHHLVAIAKAVKQHVPIPISVSCQPMNKQNIQSLAEAGVERIGIALDASTEKLFNEVKGQAVSGPYRWEDQFGKLREAISIFGKGNVTTHLIAGLGETEKEMVSTIQKCFDLGVLPALFAFTPIRGTRLANNPQPQLGTYRRIQLARYLIVNRIARCETMRFDADGRTIDFAIRKTLLRMVIATGIPFLTSGCPNCNRPFYNEKPGGSIYNYPRWINSKEKGLIMEQWHYTQNELLRKV